MAQVAGIWEGKVSTIMEACGLLAPAFLAANPSPSKSWWSSKLREIWHYRVKEDLGFPSHFLISGLQNQADFVARRAVAYRRVLFKKLPLLVREWAGRRASGGHMDSSLQVVDSNRLRG